jgi:hypothetical protein
MDRDESNPPYSLPKHVRFARSLALVSGVAIGIAAGATVFTATGCDNPEPALCLGECIGPNSLLGATRNLLMTGRIEPAATILPASLNSADGSVENASPADGGAGGGPLPAPPLPRAWLA